MQRFSVEDLMVPCRAIKGQTLHAPFLPVLQVLGAKQVGAMHSAAKRGGPDDVVAQAMLGL